MTVKFTHAVLMLGGKLTRYSQGHIVKSQMAGCLEQAQNIARAWMRGNNNMDHYVVITEVAETHYYEGILKVSKP